MKIVKKFNVEIDEERKELYFDNKKYSYESLDITDEVITFTTIKKDSFNLTTDMIDNKQRILKKYDTEYTYNIEPIKNDSIFKSLYNAEIILVSEKIINIKYASICNAYDKVYLQNQKIYSLLESVDDLKEYVMSDFTNINDWAKDKVKNSIDSFDIINKHKLYKIIPLIDTYEKYATLVNRLYQHTKMKSETTDDLYEDLYDEFTNNSEKKVGKIREFINSICN